MEIGLRPNSAGIPYTLLLRIEAIGFPTFRPILGFYCTLLREVVSILEGVIEGLEGIGTPYPSFLKHEPSVTPDVSPQ